MNSNKPTALVVADEGRVSKTMLETNGYKVITAQTATIAYNLVFAYMPDIILLDMALPDMESIQFLCKLRQHVQIPVIVINGQKTERDEILALDCGADDYIAKPFSAAILLARMRAVRRRHTAVETTENTYSVGDFCIDFAKRSVTVGGELVRLTLLEYRVVELLARQPGKTLPYSYMINRIWGPYADAKNNRILRVNVSNVRRKIERDRMKPKYILTESGAGYRMAENMSNKFIG